MVSENTVLKAIAGSIAGVGAIYLAATHVIAPEAAAAILSSLVAYFTGEANGRRSAQTTA